MLELENAHREDEAVSRRTEMRRHDGIRNRCIAVESDVALHAEIFYSALRRDGHVGEGV